MNALVITKAGCGYCIRAIELLKRKNIQFEEKVLGTVSRDFVQKMVDESNPSYGTIRTVPQIFLDGKHIGGYNELVAHLS